MKKIICFATLALALVFAGCQKEEIGGTATQDMAGQWYVHVDGIDENGEISMEDPFGMGNFLVLTFNTAANDKDSIWVDDLGNFWTFKCKVGCDLNSLTFGSEEEDDKALDAYYGISVEIYGKILPGAATTPSGMPADSIWFDVLFEDDSYVGYYWDKLRFAGYRYTGLANDD